ncbi:intraflagellar transport protein 46 homolog isoform X5 [Carassius gibelio]|uniref:intraflagellar transport protein 46 homolog isoform X5 n=1 Tax=Carassius gibelio TaxID=101364 RepID=UPI002278153B|nr:intraflagellar transport protein 46 homolog isoform X5 [Carassius gibelio]
MMPGYFIHIWLFFFAVFARESKVEEVKKGLYSRVELTGEKLDQHTADSLKSVEWTKRKGSLTCLCFIKTNTTYSVSYSQCCGTARFYLNNNTLILENVTERDEGVFIETIVTANGTKKWLNVTLTIQYPPNAIEIVVSWTSSTSVTLKCEVSGLFQHLMWKREGVSILEKHRHSFSERNQTLHISNITSSEYGSYSCIASNAYGESEKHTYITGNGTRDETRSDQTVLSSGLTLTCVLGLCLVLYCLYKYHHRHRAENGKTTDGGEAAIDLGIYQEIPDFGEVTPLPCVYTDFIKPRESSQASAAAQHFEESGYSEVGPSCREPVSNEESTACPEAGEE